MTRNKKKSIFAIPAAPAAIPPNPKIAAISARTKKVRAQLNIIDSKILRVLLFFLKNRINVSGSYKAIGMPLQIDSLFCSRIPSVVPFCSDAIGRLPTNLHVGGTSYKSFSMFLRFRLLSAWRLLLKQFANSIYCVVLLRLFFQFHSVEGIAMVSRDQLMGNWNSIVGSIKEKFGELTKDELARVEGNFEQLVGLVQRKSGQSKEQIASFISDCCESAGTTYSEVANRASHYVDVAGDAIRENYDRVASEAKKGLDYTAQSVGRRPVESLALAIGAGIVAGIMLGLSMSGRKR